MFMNNCLGASFYLFYSVLTCKLISLFLYRPKLNMNHLLSSLFFLLFPIVLNNINITAENIIPSDSGSHVSHLTPEKDYKINNFTGDSIGPLINSLGDTLKTGIPLRISSELKPFRYVSKSIHKKALKKQSMTFGFTESKLTKQALTVPYTKNNSNSFFGDKNAVLLNSIGDTIQTGVPIPVTGNTYAYNRSESFQIQFPARKELSCIDIKYLDVEQGLGSSCVVSMLQDKRGDIWLGTNGGGVSVYNGFELTNLAHKGGLKGKDIRDILEDKNGNLWFASDEGISKFDGNYFTQFTEKEGLTNNIVLCLTEDKAGNVWCGTNGGGVTCFDGRSFTHYSEKEGVSNIVTDIFEDRNGNLWLSSYTDGIFKFDGKSFEQITTKNGLSHNSVSQVYEDTYGNLWISTWGGGLCKFDGNLFTCFTENEGLIDNNVNSIGEDVKGNIWAGTWEGFSKFDGESFTNYTEGCGLSDNDVIDLMFDRQHNLWLGTWSGGVNIFNQHGFKNLTQRNGLNNAYVLSILEDKNKNIWLGNWNGINQLNDEEIIGYSNENGLNHEFGSALALDNEGSVWIGGENGELTKFDGKSFTCFTDNYMLNNAVNSVVCDKNGILWMGMERSGLCKFDGKQFEYFAAGSGLKNTAVHSILEDRNGNIWIATEGFGVAKYNGESFTFITEKEGLSSNLVISVFEDEDGILWFGTNGGGVTTYDGKEFLHITTEQGISSNYIRSITQDLNHRIWVGTNSGLNVLIKTSENENKTTSTKKQGSAPHQLSDSLVILQYNFYDGLKDIEFNTNSICCDSSNRLWLGTRKNLLMFDLSNVIFDWIPVKVKPVRIEINEQFVDFLNLDNQTKKEVQFDSLSPFINYPKNLRLTYKNNHLTFYFASDEFRSPRHVKYSYKIDGLNDNWSNPSVLTHADYQNLPKGKHTFRVKAVGQNQIWSEVLEFSFTIEPPWWNTNLALVCYFLFSVFLIFFLIKWRTYALNRRKNELVDMVDELQKAKQKAEVSEKLKSAFLLNLSHEIRTPMNGILGFTNLLNQKDLSGEEQQNYIDYINASGNRLLNTVTNLIQISSIETGLVEVNIEKVNLLNVAGDICFGFESEAKDKSIQFVYSDILSEQEFEVETDVAKFELILKHLINNALKYTSRGKVKVGFSKEEVNSEIRLNFYVEDSGTGIPKERLDAIFNRFEQADIDDKEALQGSGIGLSIARAYIEMLNGKIWVESQEGKGSTFYFTLPVKEIYYPDKQIQNRINLPTPPIKKDRLKVLIAEDDEVSSLHLSILLKQFPVDLLFAVNGKEAIQVFNSNPDIDLILMDIKMPVLSGIEAMKKIRQKDRNLVIIAQTAYAMPGDKEKALEAGCDEYITKPINQKKLLELFDKYLNTEGK